VRARAISPVSLRSVPSLAAATFEVQPLQLAPALAFGVMYHLRARHLAALGRPVASWHQACFYSGLALIALTLVSPLGGLADELFWAHMAEHLLIADIGALLLVLGFTGPVLQPLLRTTALGWLRHLAHPVPAFGLWAADLFFWHIVGPHEAAVDNDAIHAVQHMLFVGFGINMWMALLGPLPKPAWFGNFAKLLYIVVVRLTSTVLANVFVWSNDAFFGVYADGERANDISPHTDQVVAGSIMMVEGSLLTICLFGWLFLRSAREGEERQELLDLAAAGGVAIDERRVARAVSAGRGAELKRRIKDGDTR
jgi:cytochrome c oxidase assembly factor CtaG